MSKCFKTAVALGLVGLLAVPIVAATKAPAKKAPAKTTAKTPVVKGTKQWSGENADPGRAYTLEKTINFTLNSLEYSVEPLCFSSKENDPSTLSANAEQKLLVVHFTLHNPLPSEQRVLWATVSFTVVDEKNNNHEDCDVIGAEKDKQKLWVDLKPGQKIECYSAVVMPADSMVTKLIVKGDHPEMGVLRYYKEKLKVKGVPAPFANSEDKTGACVLGEVPAEQGVFYPMKNLAIRLDSVSYTSEQVKADEEVPEDSRYAVCTITYKNISAGELSVGWGEFSESKLVTDQDEDITSYQYLLPKAKKSADYVEVKPGQEKTVRLAFAISNDSNAKTLIMREGEDSRVYVFDVSGAK